MILLVSPFCFLVLYILTLKIHVLQTAIFFKELNKTSIFIFTQPFESRLVFLSAFNASYMGKSDFLGLAISDRNDISGVLVVARE